MKVIFLDHDGVICLSSNWGNRYKKARQYMIEHNILEHDPSMLNSRKRPVLVRFDDFDKKAIKVLNQILEETNAEIVVSSDWKLHANLEELGEYYESQGISKKPIAVTPKLEDFDPESSGLYAWKGWLERARCLEIQQWLKENPVDAWVAVDDLDMSNEYLKPGLDNFVKTPRSNEGIKQSGISNKIISILNKNEANVE